MNTINERYTIKNKLGESDHSAVYKGHDKIKDQTVAIKFLKKNVKFKTALKLFQKEYLVNKSLQHPNIRKALYYEKIEKIDGQNVSSEQYVQILNFIKKPLKDINNREKKEKIKHFNQIINAMQFIYKNKKHHGDIKPNNILLDKNNNIKLSDISPFFAIERKEIEDVKQLCSIFNMENLDINENLNSITDFFDLEYFDTKRHLKILYKHLEQSRIPINLTLKQKIIDEITEASKFINFYNFECLKNSKKISKGIIPYFEIQNYYYVNISNLNKNDSFNLMNVLIEKIKGLNTSKSILNKYRNQLSQISDLIDEQKSKDRKYKNKVLEETSIKLITEISSTYPIVLWIENYHDLDQYSKNIINKIYNDIDREFVQIITNSDKKLDNVLFYNIEAGLLSFKQFREIFEYYFYHTPFSKKTLSEVFYYTNGEIKHLTNFLSKIKKENALEYEDLNIRLKHDTKKYLPFLNKIDKTISNLTAKEKQVLNIIKLFNNHYNSYFLSNCSEEFKRRFKKLVDKNTVIKKDSYYRIRHNYLLSKIKPSAQNKFFKNHLSLLEKKFSPQGRYIKIYQKIQFILGNYTESFNKIINYYKQLRRNNQNFENKLFFNIIKKFKNREENLNKNQVFDLNWALYNLDLDKILDSDKLIEKMEKTYTSKEQKFKYLSNYITENENIDWQNLQKYFRYLKKEEYITNKKYAFLPISIMSKVLDLGKYKKALKLYKKHFKPHYKKLKPKQKFNLNSILYNIYLDMENIERAEKISQNMLEYVKNNSDKLSLDNKFQALNKYAIILRRKQKFKKALTYYHKCRDIAEELNNHNYLATVNVNLGVVYFYINKPEKMEKHMRKALNSSIKIKSYHAIFITIGNLMEYYRNQYDFSSIEELLEIAQKHIDNLSSRAHKSRFLIAKIDYLLFFEKINKVEKNFNKIEEYYRKQNKKLASSFVYHIQMVKYKYLKSENWQTYIQKILTNKDIASTQKGKYLFLSNLAMLFFEMGKFEIAKRFLKKIRYNYTDQFEKDERINKQLLNLLFWFFDLKDFTHKHFKVSQIKYSQVRLYYYFIFLHKYTQSDIHYYENYLNYVLMLQKILSNIPKKYKEETTNIYQKFIKFIKTKSSYESVLDIKTNTLIEKYKNKAHKKITAIQQEFFKNAVYKKFVDKDEIIKNFINETLVITQMKRGIYYEYSLENGWEKIKEIYDSNYYEENEKIKKEIFDKIILAQKDGYKEWQSLKPKENQLSYAIAIPIIDINVSRKIDRDKFESSSTPSSNIMNIRGVFYFDTKLNIMIPQKKDINYLYYLREFTNISFYNFHLINSALKDDLTDLYTRENWIALTKSLIEHVKAQNKYLGIIMIDIDDFKLINDKYGHPEGDKVLKRISTIFKTNLRNMDTAGRYGGEEFIFSIITDSIKSIKTVSSRIREKIEEANIVSENNITVSLGVSIYPDEGKFLEEIIEKADQALLHAKNTGKNKVVFWKNIKNKKLEKSYVTQKIIRDPVREENKFDLIIQLIESIDRPFSLKKMLKKINKAFYDNIGNLSVMTIIDKKNKTIFSDNSFKNSFDGEYPQNLNTNTYLLAKKSIKKNNITVGIYLIEKNSFSDFEINPQFYKFIGKLLIEKIILYYLKSN